jgi:hypothetical protein
MLSSFLTPQYYRPRRHRASGVITIALLALGLSILLAGCGGGSNKSSPESLSSNVDLASLTLSEGTLSPAFGPTTLSYSASVSGSINTLQVTPTLADSAAHLKVNGVTVASGAPSAPIALQVGANNLTVNVTAEDGATTQTTTIEVTRLLDNATGIGPNFLFPRGIALDSANNRALVVDSIPPSLADVVVVDFSTGDRTILSDGVTGMGPNFSSPRGIALDSANNRALVVDSSLAAVVAVDISTGDRIILSDDLTGMGANFSFPLGIALDSANNRALVVDSSLAAVVAVDISTGDRAILSDDLIGIGPTFSFPLGIALDSANNRALVVDSSLAAVIAVEPISGDRIIHAK